MNHNQKIQALFRHLWLCFCLSLLCLPIGCAAVPKSSVAEDEAAKTFVAPKDKGKVYVFRSRAFLGAGMVLQVSVDGRIVGTTGPGTFLAFELSPGSHRITSYAFDSSTSLPLTVEAGELYFIEQSRQMFHTLKNVPSAEGRAQILKYSLSQSESLE